MVVGELRRPRDRRRCRSSAAVGGMVVPAGDLHRVNTPWPAATPQGWAVPTATDIAFAVGRARHRRPRPAQRAAGVPAHPRGRRRPARDRRHRRRSTPTTSRCCWLAARSRSVAVFARAAAPRRARALAARAAGAARVGAHARRRACTRPSPASLLGFAVPRRRLRRPRARRAPTTTAGDDHSLRAPLWRPVSAGFAVPVFALFAAGVTLDPDAPRRPFSDPVAPRRPRGPRARQAARDRRRPPGCVARFTRAPARPRARLVGRHGRRPGRRHRLHGVAPDRRARVRRGQRRTTTTWSSRCSWRRCSRPPAAGSCCPGADASTRRSRRARRRPRWHRPPRTTRRRGSFTADDRPSTPPRCSSTARGSTGSSPPTVRASTSPWPARRTATRPSWCCCTASRRCGGRGGTRSPRSPTRATASRRMDVRGTGGVRQAAAGLRRADAGRATSPA